MGKITHIKPDCSVCLNRNISDKCKVDRELCTDFFDRTHQKEKNNACKHCKFLNKTFDPKDNREYWLYTEMFVYLHGGKDYCPKQTEHLTGSQDSPKLPESKEEEEVCPACDGEGEIVVTVHTDTPFLSVSEGVGATCPKCKGTGKILINKERKRERQE